MRRQDGGRHDAADQRDRPGRRFCFARWIGRRESGTDLHDETAYSILILAQLTAGRRSGVPASGGNPVEQEMNNGIRP